MNSAKVLPQTVHISIGSDCAVAYQLRKLGLVENAFPFDWIKCDNIKMISDTLDMEFSNFFQDYTLKKQSSNFDKFGENCKSLIKIILKNKMQFPHEANEAELDFEEFKKKYSRRIDRFNNIVRSPDYKKIFVRADSHTICDSDKKILFDAFVKFGATNFEIKYITYDDYPVIGEFTWHRSYIDWENKFI